MSPWLQYLLTVSSLSTVALLAYLANLAKRFLRQSSRANKRSKFNLHVLRREGFVEVFNEEDGSVPVPPEHED